MRRSPLARRPRVPGGSRRGSPQLRLRVGFVLIAMVLSVFGARLVQLQGLDPDSYAAMAAAEGTVDVVLPAERGDILDRNGEPLADSIDGLMVVGDPKLTEDKAPEIARFLAGRLDVDYFEPLKAPARRRTSSSSTSPAACRRAGRRPWSPRPRTRGFEGLDTRRDPVRDYPADDVAANLVGFMGTDEPLGGLEQIFNEPLAGHDGSERYEVGGGNRIPLGDTPSSRPSTARTCNTTIDRDLQWYTQRVLRQTRRGRPGRLGLRGGHGHRDRRGARPRRRPDVRRRRPAVRDGQGRPGLPRHDRRLRARLGREGAHRSSPSSTRARSRPTRRSSSRPAGSGDRVIHDWFEHGRST